MATNQVMHYCHGCRSMTMHVQPATSHTFHMLLSIFTVGIWVLIWILVAIMNSSRKACSSCGRVAGLFG